MSTKPGTPVPSSDLQRYVPYTLGKSSEGLGWRGVRAEIVRGHEPGEIQLPALDHHLLNLIVATPTRHVHRWDGRAADEIGREGAAALVPAGCESYWRWEYLRPGTACDFHLHFKPSFVRRIAQEDGAGSGVAEDLHGALCFYDPAVQVLGAGLLQEVDSGGANGALYAECLATALVLVLLKLQSAPGPVAAGRPKALPVEAIRGVCEYIEEHLAGELHLQDLAALAGLGEGSFGRAFRRVLGSTPHQYVLGRRMTRAKQLLASTKLPLTEVAQRLGFADQAHFATSFRKREGLTPSMYRSCAHK